MKKKLLLILLTFQSLFILGQNIEYGDYDWETNPERQELSEQEQKESYVLLQDKNVIEYQWDEEIKDVVRYTLTHYIVRVNDDKAIDKYNKVYIALTNVSDVIELKARTISKDGNIVEVAQNNIKEIDNYLDQGKYKLFAMEGIETGCDVEVLYKLKKGSRFYGHITLQKRGLVKNSDFEIISPKHLVFVAKVYNGQANYEDTLIEEKQFIRIHFDKIPALNTEKYSSYNANLISVEYKYDYNTTRDNSQVYTFSAAAKRFYEVIYDFDAKAEKKAKKIISSLKLKHLSDEEKIKKIENYVKNNYAINENYSAEVENLNFVFKNKFSTETGILRLFAALYSQAGIKHQVVITSNRSELKFDKDFMSWNFLNDIMMYFPAQDKFLSPGNFAYRYGMIPFNFTNTYGLFLKIVEIGDFKTAMPELKFIPANSLENDYNKTTINVKIGNNFSNAEIETNIVLCGHTAMFIHPYYKFLEEKEKEEIIDVLLKRVSEDATILTRNVTNDDNDFSPIEKPFTIHGNYTTKSIIEKAGENYLFKLGMLLGEQVEMYEDKDRQTEIEIPYPHSLIRKISFQIPEGYEIKGLENTKINIEHGNTEKNTMGFISDYLKEGNTITIDINEYYSEVTYPIDQYEQFKEVINAAADFNKVVLVFEAIKK